MQELLPQKVLLKYLSKIDFSEEFKAILCFMMLNLYVDKEPRCIINKPNFVRLFRPVKPETPKVFGGFGGLIPRGGGDKNQIMQEPDEKGFRSEK